MSYRKIRDWDESKDGIFPVHSKAHSDKRPVVLKGADGEFFGWEHNGKIVCGSRLTFNAAAEKDRLTAAESIATEAAKATTLRATYARIKASRKSGNRLSRSELDALADLFISSHEF